MWFIDGLKYGKRRVQPVLKKILDPPLNQKHFPFNLNVRFKFSATFSSEWNRIVQNFQKRGQPREVCANFPKKFLGSFLSIQLCSQNFWNFFPGNVCTKLFKLLKVLVEWKAPQDGLSLWY